ncbi:MAG: serine/threonine protein kinase, partial [Oscillospiraceae bacterium]|nr:serine/threonine protein kinase [Oscillospiraceae bacterium]
MLQQGEILNNTYKVIGHIGSGGGGSVYRAYHLNLKKDVVLKLINDKAKKSLDARGEVDILKNVKHTYLPTVFDFQEVNGQIYTVMDFVEGSDFSKLLKDGQRFSQKDVIRWAVQLCEALDYLHKQDPPIIHSDIKPANIMLTPKGDICLIDFNVSQLFSDDGTVVRGRTHGYAPPEQYDTTKSREYTYSEETRLDDTVLDSETVTDDNAVAGTSPSLKTKGFGVSQKLDARSDIYSLGATLYHILSGVRPNHSMQP